ncbi:MAG: hypothetical protein GY928_33775 [Colwellia sp.]|nr:hypothetical protein [Colwellia sp.]
MNVKELKELLESMNDADLVILSKDSEGNSFSPLDGHSKEVYAPDSSCSGDIYIRELTPELEKQGYGNDDVYHGDDGKNAIVLWPIN